MLKLELQYFVQWWEEQLTGEDPDTGKDWRKKEKREAENEMVRYHHWLNRHEFEQTLGVAKDRKTWHAAVPGIAELDTT